MDDTKGEYNCRNCQGKVVYHPNSGWGHIIATGCVKPAVNIKDWRIYLKRQALAKAQSKTKKKR